MFPFLVYSSSSLPGILWKAKIFLSHGSGAERYADKNRVDFAMTRLVNHSSPNRRDAVPDSIGSGSRWRVWLLEGVILILIGLNAYLVYSVVSSSVFFSSAERSAAAVVDPSAFQVQVEVLNGCGERGIGQLAMRYLRDRGFDVVNIDNADHFGYRETIVLDRKGTDGPSEAARAVGNALGTQYVLLERNEDRLVDVSVVIGGDFDELLFYEEND